MAHEISKALSREWRTPLGSRFITHTLSRLRRGQLTLVLPGGRRQIFTGDHPGPVATLTLQRPLRLGARLMRHGDIGLAEGYMAGDWECSDLTELLHLLALNEPYFGQRASGQRLWRLVDRLQHLLRGNTLRGSRRNIAFHYDLGNDFYRLWLDESMTYSSALFASAAEPLQVAQTRKYAQILERLDATPGQHILEIGCGWGGFAEFAASQGYRVTGITLSQEQLDYARARIARAGLADRVALRLQDYRSLTEQFDHIVSIEMFEAVGERYWGDYFATVRRSLKRGGRASLQVITIDHDAFEQYRRGADFIQKYIFPGGMLPSVTLFDEVAQGHGLTVRARSFHGMDYAHTLRRWDQRFAGVTNAVSAQGFDERFQRMWRYYLAYCEAGFRSGRIDLMQVALEAK